MAVDSLSSTFTGRVASVNDRGLRLDGHTDWYNVSKFTPGVVLPERGSVVTVAVDSKGFLRACELADGSVATNGASSPHTAPSSHKDRTITRLAVLKAAAEFGASRPSLKSGDVLLIAASWERWVLRDTDAVDDLVDAF